MSGNETEQLSGVIPELERQIAIAKGHGLSIATQLLEMARLEVMLRLHGISNEELAQFCAAIEGDTAPPPAISSIMDANIMAGARVRVAGPTHRRQSVSRSRARSIKGA